MRADSSVSKLANYGMDEWGLISGKGKNISIRLHVYEYFVE
jgi:hypothetical protein